MGFSENNFFAIGTVTILVLISFAAYFFGVRRKDFYAAVVVTGLILVIASVAKRKTQYCSDALESGRLVNVELPKSYTVTNGLIHFNEKVSGNFDCDKDQLTIYDTIYYREIIGEAIKYRSQTNPSVVYTWLPD